MFSPSTHVAPVLRTWLVACGLAALTVALFSRAGEFGFSNYDDPRYITQNPHVQAGLARDSIAWAFAGKADYWHPLTWLSHMLDWEIHGANASGHRFTSTLWHALNAALAFLVLRRLTGAFWISALSAALFAWHPLRVESVVWIAERKDVMSGCFFLLTLWGYTAYADRRRQQRRAWPQYLLTFACFVAGLMSKPVLVTLPLVLLALDFWPLERAAASWKAFGLLVLEKVPFFALSGAISVVTVVMQRHDGAFVLELPLGARLANALVSVWRYLGKFVWPTDLTPFYPHPGQWPLAIALAAFSAIVGALFVVWRQRRRRPWLLTGLVWFAAMLLPVIGIVQVGFQAMADRYMYLPTLGLQLALLWTARELLRPPGVARLAAPAALALLAAFAARTWSQQATWRDPLTLLRHALAVTEKNAIAEGFLGYTLAGLGQLDEAERHCQRALELDPKNTTALYALAEIRAEQGRLADAIALHREVLRIEPSDPDSHYKVGLLLLRQGQSDAAIDHLKAATRQRPHYLQSNLRLATAELERGYPQIALARFQLAAAVDPANVEAHVGAGLALARLGKPDEALTHFETATRLAPRHAVAHLEAGLIHVTHRRAGEAAHHFRAALEAEPNFALGHLGLGRALEQLGQPAEATTRFQRALELAPDNPQVHRVWADTLARRREFARASEHYRRAVALQPDDAEAHAGLGFALFLSGRRDEGIAAWEEALRLKPDFPGLRQRIDQARRP